MPGRGDEAGGDGRSIAGDSSGERRAPGGPGARARRPRSRQPAAAPVPFEYSLQSRAGRAAQASASESSDVRGFTRLRLLTQAKTSARNTRMQRSHRAHHHATTRYTDLLIVLAPWVVPSHKQAQSTNSFVPGRRDNVKGITRFEPSLPPRSGHFDCVAEASGLVTATRPSLCAHHPTRGPSPVAPSLSA